MISGGHVTLLIFGLVLLATSGESLASTLLRELGESREDSPTGNLSRLNKKRNILISFNVDLQRDYFIECCFIRRRYLLEYGFFSLYVNNVNVIYLHLLF